MQSDDIQRDASIKFMSSITDEWIQITQHLQSLILIKKMVFLFFMIAASFQIINSIEFVSSQGTATYSQVSEGIITASGNVSSCSKIVVENDHLYHLSSNYLLQIWTKGNITQPITQLIIPNSKIVDYTVAPSGNTLAFASRSLDGLSTQLQFWKHTNSMLSKTTSTALLSTPDSIFLSENSLLLFYSQQLIVNHSIIIKLPIQTNSIPIAANFTSKQAKISISPDYQIIVAWNKSSFAAFYDGNDLSLKAILVPDVIPPLETTKKVTFSRDSLYAVIQTDHYNPIVVVDLSTYEVKFRVAINETIQEVHFLQDNVLIVICENSTFLVDLASNNQLYILPTIFGDSLEVDMDNNVFTCRNNTLSQVKVTFSRNNLLSDASFYNPVKFDSDKEPIYGAINDSLQVTSRVTSALSAFASSTPLMIYFLGFINYFTLNSLYVLLNFKIPEHVFKHLKGVQNEINSDLLSLTGTTFSFPQVSGEKVNQQKALFFKISSDLLSSQSMPIVILISNMLLIYLLVWFGSKLSKHSFVRKLFKEEQSEVKQGQIINILVPLSLPWSFNLLQMGYSDLGTKLNMFFFLLMFALPIGFPLYYLYCRIQQQKQQLHKDRQGKFKEVQTQKVKRKELKTKPSLNCKAVKFSNQLVAKTQINLKKVTENIKPSLCRAQNRIFIEMKANIEGKANPEKKTLSFLLTSDLAEQWYLCQANFLYPTLILLSNPQFFLIIILLFLMFGALIAVKKQERKVNSVMLSLYPLAFHVCFMVFYWSDQSLVEQVTQLICLGIFLLGSLHHCLVSIYDVFLFVKKVAKNICKTSQIKPEGDKSKQKSDNFSQSNSEERQGSVLKQNDSPLGKVQFKFSLKVKNVLDRERLDTLQINPVSMEHSL